MARRKRISGLKDISSTALGLLPIVGGLALAKVLDKTAIGGKYSNLIKIGGGLVLATSMKGTMGQVGIGLALSGAQDLVNPALAAAGIGLLEPGMPARYIAGLDDAPGAIKTDTPLGF